MTSIDFAEAQQRVLTRRQDRASAERSRTRSKDSPVSTHALSTLPFPLGGIGQGGLRIWESIKGREGTDIAFRVGQVDAELLDEELLDLFKGQVGEALKYYGSHIRNDWSSEISLGLRAILFKLSIWDHNASYGATLQDLSYTDARHRGPLPKIPTKWQKACYGLVTVGGRYSWTKWEEWLSDQEGGMEEPSRNIRIISRISDLVSTVHSIAALVSFLVFLTNGRYRTLLDRVLRMRLVPPANQARREVSFEYLNRQLVWHAFTEFLLFLLPLVGISRWRKLISRAWKKAKDALRGSTAHDDEEDSTAGEMSFLPERTCAICYQDQNMVSTAADQGANSGASGGIIGSAQTDVTNPYEATCGCVYCYVCIATRLEAEEGEAWICLRCGRHVYGCQPWAGDVLQDAVSKRNSAGFAKD